MPFPFPTTPERSRLLARVRQRNTAPEVRLRAALRSRGVAYRLHGSGLAGRPDVCFPGRRVVVFVDGCFWHGCPVHYRTPKSNQAYWGPKIERNQARDARQTRALEQAGWVVLRVWEHEIRDSLPDVVERIERALGLWDDPGES